jgi:hypothetical protein
MATYNSLPYAQSLGGTAYLGESGAATPPSLFGSGRFVGGYKRATLIPFNCALQTLNSGDVVNLIVLPAAVIISSIQVLNDTGTASATLKVGTTSNASYFTTGTVSLATASSRSEAFTALTDFGSPLAAATTLIATVGGATVATGNLYVLIEYLSN